MLPAVRLLVITRQFRTPHWFPCEMTSEKPQQTTSEIPYCWRQWRVTTKIWVVLLIGWNKFLSRHDQSEELPRSVTRHQYGIAALVFQTSFRGETIGGVLKCRLFSQATQRHVVSWALGKKSPVHFCLSCGLVIFYCRRIWFNVSIVHPLHALSLRSSHQTMSFFGVCSISLGKKEMNLRFKLTRSVLSFCKRNDHLFQLNHVIVFVPACVRSRMKLKQVGGLCSATF